MIWVQAWDGWMSIKSSMAGHNEKRSISAIGKLIGDSVSSLRKIWPLQVRREIFNLIIRCCEFFKQYFRTFKTNFYLQLCKSYIVNSIYKIYYLQLSIKCNPTASNTIIRFLFMWHKKLCICQFHCKNLGKFRLISN